MRKIHITGEVWDAAKHARELDRHAFICAFVARQTRKKENRDLTGDMQVVQTATGWTWLHHLGRTKVTMSAPMTAANCYDAIRRTQLYYFVRQAEEYRDDVLTADAARGVQAGGKRRHALSRRKRPVKRRRHAPTLQQLLGV